MHMVANLQLAGVPPLATPTLQAAQNPRLWHTSMPRCPTHLHADTMGVSDYTKSALGLMWGAGWLSIAYSCWAAVLPPVLVLRWVGVPR